MQFSLIAVHDVTGDAREDVDDEQECRSENQLWVGRQRIYHRTRDRVGKLFGKSHEKNGNSACGTYRKV